MATIKIVPDADMQVLEKYLQDSSTILIPQEVFEKLPELHQSLITESALADYNFGGDPDKRLDIVRSKACYAMDALLEANGYDPDEIEQSTGAEASSGARSGSVLQG